ncbi:MAG: methyltransferase domain-containing protein [Acidimicrobiales bacterium]
MMMAEQAQTSEASLWVTAGIVPGEIVADVGCGPGAVAVCMARAVGSSGRVIGVERDEVALAAARQLVAQSGLANVELRHGSATDPGVPDESVGGAVTRHVLAHNQPDEQHMVDHLARLVRPGGHV